MIDKKSFGEEENRILEEIIKKNTVSTKGNFFDYYNDEEKEAIHWCEHMHDEIGKAPYDCPMNKDIDNVKILVDLVKKQQKEIEELNEEVDRQHKFLCEIHNKNEEKIKDLKLQHILEIQKKDKIIDLICECVFRKFTAHLVIEYGIENKEQLKEKFIQYFEKEEEND